MSWNKGLSEKELIEDLERRKKVLDWMVKKKIQSYKEVFDIFSRYRNSPEEVMNK
jgi:hypothetical protein